MGWMLIYEKAHQLPYQKLKYQAKDTLNKNMSHAK